MPLPHVVVVEDVPALAASYAAYLRDERCSVSIAATGAEALAIIEKSPVSVVVADVHLPDMSGLDILRHVGGLGSPAEVVVVTSEGSVKLAVEAMRFGAFDFIVKPFTRERLAVTVRNALERRRLANTVAQAAEAGEGGAVGRFVGGSLAMQRVYGLLKSAAPSSASVFITGESGTGKELCADALHRLSKRASGPFVAVNCAAIPRDLLESEIFGHVKGAFSGATSDRKGAAWQADGGTLFLDEIGELDLALQSKLLRFLQERTIQRVGEDFQRKIDARIVCATNRDPVAEIGAGRFREDLYYRLHVVPVELPPLRERDEDVLVLARHFLETFSAEDGKAFRRIAPEAEAVLRTYSWPGNIRQLQNVIRSIVVLNVGEAVTLDMLPRELRLGLDPCARAAHMAARQACDIAPNNGVEPLEKTIGAAIERALAQFNGSIPRAAQALEVSPSTLYRRLQGAQNAA